MVNVFGFEDSNLRKILDLAHAVMVEKFELKNPECNLVEIEDDKMQEMNNQYRGKDKTTDVLSFPLEDGNFIGEIYISKNQATRQAKEIGNTLNQEICFLFIHGFLHLIGYDHIEEKDEVVMLKLQKEIIKELGELYEKI